MESLGQILVGKRWFLACTLMNFLNNIFLNTFQEALRRTVPGHRGHSHIQRLPAPRRRAAAQPAGGVHQAVTRERHGALLQERHLVAPREAKMRNRQLAKVRGGERVRAEVTPRGSPVQLSARLLRFENCSEFPGGESKMFTGIWSFSGLVLERIGFPP